MSETRVEHDEEGNPTLVLSAEEAPGNLRALRNGQTILPGAEAEVVDNTGIIRARMKDLLKELDLADAEIGVTVKIPSEAFVNGVYMDVTTKIAVTMKPQKQEEGG